MKIINQLFKIHSIRIKLFLLVSLIISPVLLGLGWYNLQSAYQATLQNQQNDMDFLLLQIDNSLSSIIESIKNISDFLVTNRTVDDYLRLTDPESLTSIRTLISLNELSYNLIVSNTHISGFALYNFNYSQPYAISRDASSGFLATNRLLQQPELEPIQSLLGGYSFSFVPRGTSFLMDRNLEDKLVLGRLLLERFNFVPNGYLFLTTNISNLERQLSRGLNTDVYSYTILNPEGEHVISSRNFFPANLHGQAHLSIAANLTSIPGWTLELFADSSYSRDDLNRLRLFNGVLIISTLILSLVFIYFAIQYLTRSLLSLTGIIQKFSDGDLEARVEEIQDDEIGTVSIVFNEMANNIRNLIKDNYQKTIRTKESELESLYAKINPHFLYNTLDSIYWSAINDGSKKTANMVIALSNLFRASLNSSKHVVSLKEEILLVNHFLMLQSVRLGDSLTFAIDIDDEVSDVQIPRMTILPLVENSFTHGFTTKLEHYNLEVVGKKIADHLVITISDNGVGIPIDDLISLNNAVALEDHSQYKHAIPNLKGRLSELYGDLARIELHQSQPSGLKICIYVPVKWDYVQ